MMCAFYVQSCLNIYTACVVKDSRKNYILMFLSLKTDYFQLWLLLKSDLRISTAEETIRIK